MLTRAPRLLLALLAGVPACGPRAPRSRMPAPPPSTDTGPPADAADVGGAEGSDATQGGEDVPPPDAHRITISVTGDGAGRVVSTPPGIDCPDDCEAYFPTGTNMTLEPQPEGGSRFDRWAGACVMQGQTVELVVAASAHCTAFFVPDPG